MNTVSTSPPPLEADATAPPASPGGPTLSHRAAHGAAWAAGTAAGASVLMLVVQIALTYLLTPGEFGLWALALPVLMLSSFLQNAGMREVLIHRRKRQHLWITPAFWLNTTLGAVASLGGIAVAFPLAMVYSRPEVGWLVVSIAGVPLLTSLGVVPDAVLSTQLRFKTVAIGNILMSALAGVLLVGGALVGAGAFTFAIANTVGAAARAAYLWSMARPRIRGRPRAGRWRYLLKDASRVLGVALVRWFINFGDYMILGLFAASASVGVYYLAYSIALMPFRMIALNLSSVLFPSLATLQDDPPRLRSAYFRAARAITFVGAPICLGLAATSDLFTRAFLDAEKWAALPPVLAVISVGIYFRILETPTDGMLYAQGRFRRSFGIALASALVFVVAVFIGSIPGDALVTASVVACFFLIVGPVHQRIAVAPVGGRWADVARTFLPSFALAAASIAGARGLAELLPDSLPRIDGVRLVVTVLLAGVAYPLLASAVRLPEQSELGERALALLPHRIQRTIGSSTTLRVLFGLRPR